MKDAMDEAEKENVLMRKGRLFDKLLKAAERVAANEPQVGKPVRVRLADDVEAIGLLVEKAKESLALDAAEHAAYCGNLLKK